MDWKILRDAQDDRKKTIIDVFPYSIPVAFTVQRPLNGERS